MNNFKLLSIAFLILISFNVDAQVFSGEAESADESNVELIVNCAGASGGQVARLGNVGGKFLEWNTINLTEAGTYQLEIGYYSNADLINMNMEVNNAASELLTFTKVGFCAAITTFSTTVSLNSGTNKIRFSNIDGTQAPFVDKIDLFETTENIPVSSVTVSATGEATSVVEFSYLQMIATVLPTNAENKTVSWSVTNETGLASITNTGILVADKAGTVTVRATANDGSEQFGEQLITITENTEEGLIHKVEAEFGILTSGAEITAATCVNKSGEGLVKYADALTATSAHGNITVAESANYLMELSYFSAINSFNTRINFSVDDLSFSDPRTLELDNVGFCSEGPVSKKGFVINLEAGSHTLYFKNTGLPNTNEPLIDIIEIKELSQIDVTSITVSSTGNATTVNLSNTLQVSAMVLPEDASDPSVSWSVTNGSGSATIDAEGLITPESLGFITVVASANDGSSVTGTLDLEITEDIPVTEIIVSGQDNSTSVTEFESIQFTATVSPANATNPSVEWSVINTSGLAAINAEGRLIAYKTGQVTVLANALDGTNVSGELTITINDNTESGLVYRSEAEDGELLSGAVLVAESCENKSGSGVVKFSDSQFSNATYPNVNVPAAGNYSLILTYFSGNTSLLEFSSDGTNYEELDFDNVGFCDAGAAGQKSFTINLEAGLQTFYFRNSGQTIPEPLLDIIELKELTNIQVESITVAAEEGATSISLSETLQMLAEVSPANASNTSVSWSVSDGTGSATISENGLLTPVSPGLVTVLATATDESGVSGSMEITINEAIAVSEINISSVGNLNEIEEFTSILLVAEVLPTNAVNREVNWTVQNITGIATVNSAGLVIAHKAGTIVVKAIAADGSGVEDTFPVTIVENTESALEYRIEAEYGELTSGAVIVAPDCENKTGDGIVKFSDSQSAQVTYDNIEIENAGEYLLRLTYFSGNTALLEYSTDDSNYSEINFDNVGFCDSGVPATIDIPISFIAGSNSLYIRNSGQTVAEPLLDLVEVIRQESVIVSSIVVNSEEGTSLVKGTISQMAAVISPENASDKSVSWSVTNETGEATIDENGLLTAVSAGSVLVRATSNDQSATVGSLQIEITDEDINPTVPNIVVIVVDDAGYADFGFQNSDLMETPNLDELRSEGTFFSQAYVTNSVCAPSRAGIITGRYQNRFGFEYNIVDYLPTPGRTDADVGLDPDEKTIADHLKPLGYSTAMIGKWHLGEEDVHHPNNRGFDYFYGLLGGSRPYFTTADLPPSKKLMRNQEIDDLTEGYMTDILTDDAISWINDQIDGGKPFFTYLSYTAVHGPYESKAEDLARYDDCESCSDKRKNLAAMTYNFDQNLGRLMDSLKAKGVYDQTIFMVINDNGGVSPGTITNNGQLRGGKSSQFEGGLRVPFILKWKDKVPANNTYNNQVISTDIAATAIVAAGGDLPETKPLDGVDLVPVINSEGSIAHDYLFWRKMFEWSVVIKDNKKLIIDFNDPLTESDNDTTLYDLNIDISESNNLYNGSKEATTSGLLSAYESWEATLALPDWLGKFQYDKLCDDVSDNFANCSFIQEIYATTEFSLEFEAETGSLEGETAEIRTTCSTASEGAFVRLLSDSQNSLTFDNIVVEDAGKYRLTSTYYTADGGILQIVVNGTPVESEYPAANWCFEGPATTWDIGIQLNSGSNTIVFKPVEGKASPLLDKFSIKKLKSSVVSIASNRIRMLPNESVELEFLTSESVVSDQTFDIEVTGLSSDAYNLSSSTVTIPIGADRASVIFSSTESLGKGTFTISNPSVELEFGDQVSGIIDIVDMPTIFYVSQSGDDENSGDSMEEPLQTVAAISSLRTIPGDSILFRRGDVFNGQLKVNNSGTDEQMIVFSSYGDESLDKPVIDGSIDADGAFISAVYIRNQQYIEISNLKLTNDRSNSGSRKGVPDEVAYGLYLINDKPDATLQKFRFNNLDIVDVYPAGDASAVDFNAIEIGGIYIVNPRNSAETGLRTIRDISIENNFISHVGKLAIWIRHRGGAKDSEGNFQVGDEAGNKIQDVVIRNNHTFETGGSGLVLSGVNKALVESNTFEFPGSDIDPRMAARGSGAWVFASHNIILQHNASLHARGPADSYGYHIDYGNEYIIFQYNYSEDAEGGFVEILGDNLYSTYRYNISVNDGFRPSANTLWVSNFAGTNRDISSDENYIYNNSVFVGGNITPDILIRGTDTYVFNNIFYTADQAKIGESTLSIPLDGGKLTVANNVYFGDINDVFTDFDTNPVFGNPRYDNPGLTDPVGYIIKEGSPAVNASLDFNEPLFPEAGKGIFREITEKATKDFFGNPVDLTASPHIGAFNGVPVEIPKIKVNLSMDLTSLSAGESATISAVAASEVLDDQSVTIAVTDIDDKLYTLTQNVITIAANETTGFLEITANADNDNLEDVKGSISISEFSDGLEAGDQINVPLTIIKIELPPVYVKDDIGESELTLYPNPVEGFFTLDIANKSVKEIEISNLEGKSLLKIPYQNQRVDISHFKRGIYLLSVTTSNAEVINIKIIKQ